MATSKTPEQFQGPDLATPESAWQALDEEPSPAPAAGSSAHAEQMEQMALYHARCDDAASACWYLCRSLGAARQLEPGAPNLELLFELLGALADIPAELAASPEQAPTEVLGEADGLGVFELCQQLQAAREASQQAWAERQDEAGPAALLH